MKIVFIKQHKINSKQYKKDDKANVSKEIATFLIDNKIAKKVKEVKDGNI